MFTIKNIKDIEIQYTGKEIAYQLPSKTPFIFSESNVSFVANRFLRIMEDITHIPNDDIRYFIQNEKKKELETTSTSKVYRPGDAMLYPRSSSELDMKVLYAEEKKGRWKDVPLSIKAQALLDTDDSWMISKIPIVTYDKVWDIENELKKIMEENDITKSKPYLKKILEQNVPENMYVIGGGVWYPVGSKNGIIYTETKKIVNDDSLFKDLSVTKSLNTGGQISQCISDGEELWSIEKEFLGNSGICLTNELVGTSVFMYGNTMMNPSLSLKELMSIAPSKENSLIWINEEEEKVLQYERFTFPNRETIQENYFRQPLMYRWLGDKEKIDNLVRNNELSYYEASNIEVM